MCGPGMWLLVLLLTGGSMQKQEWKDKYIQRMVDAGLSKGEAEDDYNAGIDDHDYEDDPEMAADESLSYWAADAM